MHSFFVSFPSYSPCSCVLELPAFFVHWQLLDNKLTGWFLLMRTLMLFWDSIDAFAFFLKPIHHAHVYLNFPPFLRLITWQQASHTFTGAQASRRSVRICRALDACHPNDLHFPVGSAPLQFTILSNPDLFQFYNFNEFNPKWLTSVFAFILFLFDYQNQVLQGWVKFDFQYTWPVPILNM